MYKYFKRAADIAVAAVGTIVLSPVLVVSAAAIKFEDKGPALFKQKRAGKNGKIFTVYKFRTMKTQTHDENGNELGDFERMTKVGSFLRKTSIDELPQLFNILKGDMSLIGPRPLLVEYLDLYTPEQMRRHEVTPGITGLAQVNGRNAISWEEKFGYDIYYVDHFGLKLDIKIFFKSISSVLKEEGINCYETNTMEKFTGTVKENAEEALK